MARNAKFCAYGWGAAWRACSWGIRASSGAGRVFVHHAGQHRGTRPQGKRKGAAWGERDAFRGAVSNLYGGRRDLINQPYGANDLTYVRQRT